MAVTAAAVLCMGGMAYAQQGGGMAGPGDNDTGAHRAHAATQDRDATGSPRGLQKTDTNAGGDSRMNERTDDRSNTRDQNGMAGDRGMAGADRDRMRTNTTTNVRMRGNTIRITDVQRTRIKEVFRMRPGPRLTHVTFRVGVGARIPRTVRIVAVPPEIVSIYPEWQGYSFFETADEIVIVDPMSFAIVGVLPL
jgi:hypothetical protein